MCIPAASCCRDSLALAVTETEERRDALADISITQHLANLQANVDKATLAEAPGCMNDAMLLQLEFQQHRIEPVSFASKLAWITDRLVSPNAIYAVNTYTSTASQMFEIGNQLVAAEEDTKYTLNELQGYAIEHLTDPGVIELNKVVSLLHNVNEFWRKSLLAVIRDIDSVKYVAQVPQGTVQKLPEHVANYCSNFKARYPEWRYPWDE